MRYGINMKNEIKWIACKDKLPPQGILVKTKIHDKGGCRNEATLFLRGNLWFIPDSSMYVYYNPTHWSMEKK